MKKLAILLLLMFSSGCSLSSKFHNMVNAATKQEPGWNLSGYVVKNDSKEIKMGSVSGEILYDLAEDSPRDRNLEKDIKSEGFIFGFFLKKSF